MEIAPQIFNAKVMHRRLLPKLKQFTYGIYYVVLPLSQLRGNATTSQFAINRRAMVSFQEKDHGARDGGCLTEWVRLILSNNGLDEITENIVLVTMPRVVGYEFNPVSFWLCLDSEGALRAVLCEVNNTFGETHSYLCMHEDKQPIQREEWISAEKVFHVSPFLKREGSYRFRFSLKGARLGIWIDYCNSEDNKQLITSLIGSLEPLTRKAVRRAFWRHPLLPLKALTLIHWHALGLFLKGIRFNTKPEQKQERLTNSAHYTNTSKMTNG